MLSAFLHFAAAMLFARTSLAHLAHFDCSQGNLNGIMIFLALLLSITINATDVIIESIKPARGPEAGGTVI